MYTLTNPWLQEASTSATVVLVKDNSKSPVITKNNRNLKQAKDLRYSYIIRKQDR